MKSLAGQVARFGLTRLIGNSNVKAIINFLSRFSDIDLLTTAYENMGIMRNDVPLSGEHHSVSGERWFVGSKLREYINNTKPVLFDVGANRGEYSQLLRNHFSDADIYAFEPNPHTFEETRQLQSLYVRWFNQGFSSASGSTDIYIPRNNRSSVLATVHKDVLLDLHKQADFEAVNIVLTTIDNFCREHEVESIDFLKIDTEGHEYEVLCGAADMLSTGKIAVIQFEFNEMNVISKVFLKDLLDLLRDYSVYRLAAHKLIPLFPYSSVNEIFQAQNLIAIHKRLIS